MQLLPDAVVLGTIASLIAGLATGLGALPVLFGGNFRERTMDMMLGFAAGVMLAASTFSLLIPSLNLGNIWITTIGFSVGGIFLFLAAKYIPHEHFLKGHNGPSSSLARIWLLVLAIMLHNFPEGIAVGIAYASGDTSSIGFVVAIAITLHNIPEGLAVAMPMVREGHSRKKAAGFALATGLVEPIGAFLGASVVTIMEFLLPYGFAFAAGAMILVVSHEMIPESHSGGYEKWATFGVMLGFILMMILDSTLG
jgi:ZIP family zinc transporter